MDRICCVCDKSFEVEEELFNKVKYITSKNGVGIKLGYLFKWFCNDCYNQIIKYYREV